MDAAHSCGSNPGLFIAIRDLDPELSLFFVPSLSHQAGKVWAQWMRLVLAVLTMVAFWNWTAGSFMVEISYFDSMRVFFSLVSIFLPALSP
jgi:hypothetical protein